MNGMTMDVGIERRAVQSSALIRGRSVLLLQHRSSLHALGAAPVQGTCTSTTCPWGGVVGNAAQTSKGAELARHSANRLGGLTGGRGVEPWCAALGALATKLRTVARASSASSRLLCRFASRSAQYSFKRFSSCREMTR